MPAPTVHEGNSFLQAEETCWVDQVEVLMQCMWHAREVHKRCGDKVHWRHVDVGVGLRCEAELTDATENAVDEIVFVGYAAFCMT